MSEDLHDLIMNIPGKRTEFWTKADRVNHAEGHRDARHAAAELAIGYAAAIAASQQAAPKMDNWNLQMSCVKALLNCTDGELECIGEKLLDSYIEDVKRVVAAALASLPPTQEA